MRWKRSFAQKATFSIVTGKMARLSIEERIAIVLLFAKHESPTAVQVLFTARFNKPAPSRENILRLYRKFEQTGNVDDIKRAGKHSI